MKRIYYSELSAYNQHQALVITGDAAHYLNHVLRVKPGDNIQLFDGNGCTAQCTITIIKRKHVSAHVLSMQNETKPTYLPALIISMCKKFDVIIEKATELGVGQIQPIYSAYSPFSFNAAKYPSKVVHWNKIIIAASAQSRRNYLPQILHPLPFPEWIAQLPASFNGIFGSPISHNISSVTYDFTQPTVLTIGPEGGFSDNEVAILLENGFQPMRLSPHILRSETASISILASYWQHLYLSGLTQ